MKKKLSLIMTFILLVGVLNINNVTLTQVYAADNLFDWNKDDTLDTTLTIVEDKSSDDEILLECLMESSGTYSLVYYLEDSRRTTVELERQYDVLQISYMVEEVDATTSPAIVTNITQNLADASYLEMDYDATVPDWEYIADKTVNATSGALEYEVAYSASNEYPGIVFEMENKKVSIFWEYTTDMLYYMISDCGQGNIMPVTYTTPSSGSQEMKVLTDLENFDVVATHLTPDGENLEIVESEDDDNSPGSRPGLQIAFTQPKELDESDWTYKESETNLDNIKAIVELEDIGSDAYIDFTFDLNTSTNAAIKTIDELPDEDGQNDNVEYTYDTGSYTYSINIVQDKTDLPNQENLVQWSELEASKIYNAAIGFQIDLDETAYNDYEFSSYMPEDGFAFTFLDYDLKRANLSEAYLDIVPYDIGDSEEVEYSILYGKVVSPEDGLDPKDDLWVQHYYDGDENENIYIPVEFDEGSSQDIYQVIIEFSGVDIESQILDYSAVDDNNVPPSTPDIEEIDNLYVVPSEDESGTEPSKVQFDLIWEAPNNTTTMELDTIFSNEDGDITNDRIYYELLVNKVTEDSDENPFKVIKVFEVYKETDDGDYKVKLHDVVTGNATASGISYYDFGYNANDELFRMEEITIYENGGWTNVYDVVADDTINEYTVTDSGEAYDFEYPGVNYIRLRAIAEIDGEIGISDDSVVASLSLSEADYDIPIPSALDYDSELSDADDETVGVEFSFHSVDASTYEEYMIEPIDKKIQSIIYGVYISEDSDEILNLDTSNTSYTAILISSDDLVEVDSASLELLRDYEVIYYRHGTSTDTDETISVEIDGLDQNTNYYMRVVTILDIIDLDGSDDEERYGEPSSMLSITTPSNVEDPDADELKPLAVENLEVSDADDTEVTALIEWDYQEENQFEEDSYGFEIMAIKSSELDDDYNSNEIMLEDIIESDYFTSSAIEFFRIYVEDEDQVAAKYNPDTGEFEAEDSDLLSVDEDELHIEFIDSENATNTVYYYYVRTINISGSAVLAASAWQVDSYTTSPVDSPINLEVLYDSGYNYDDETEAIISFDVPIPSGSDLDNDYLMEIWIKGDDDEGYSDTDYSNEYLDEGESDEDGYIKLYYSIGGLDSGSSYNVKVRIEDRTQELETLPDGTETYAVSAFSDTITIRTEFNQEDYDKEIILEDYVEYFEMKAEALLDTSYFILSETDTESIIKYRESYMTGELAYYANSEYDLVIDSTTKNVLYLPAEFIEIANEYNVTLNIESDYYSFSILPDSIGSGITDEITDIEDDIDGYDVDAVDYYIKFEIISGEYGENIYGKTPSGDVANIQINIIGSEETEANIDEEMEDELASIIESYVTTVSTELGIELYYGIDEDNLLEVIEAAIEEVEEEFESEATEILEKYLDSTTYSLNSLEKDMNIRLNPYLNNTDNDVYMLEGGVWQNQDSTYYSNSYYFQEDNLTSYILVSWDTSDSELSETYSDDEIELIYKYALTEIFSTSELSDGDDGVSKYQMVASFARLLESGSANDTYNYLQDQGIDLNNDNMYTDVDLEECQYIYIQVFAEKHNIDLDSVKITDYNIIDNIDDIEEDYQQTFIQGANISIIEPENDIVNTDEEVTIEDLIYLLTKIENGLDW